MSVALKIQAKITNWPFIIKFIMVHLLVLLSFLRKSLLIFKMNQNEPAQLLNKPKEIDNFGKRMKKNTNYEGKIPDSCSNDIDICSCM